MLGDGVSELERETGARMPLRIRTIRALRRNATPFYLSSTIGLTAWFLALSLTVAWAVGVRQPLMLTILGTLSLFPLSELAIQIVNALVISLLPPEPLPKMDFKEGIPPEPHHVSRRAHDAVEHGRRAPGSRKAGSPLSCESRSQRFLQPVS